MADKKRVLIIDDEKDFGRLLKRNLEEKGLYEVLYETNGESGVKTAEEFCPDLILVDIAMPGIDGYQTCERIRNKPSLKNTKILFLTGKELVPDKIIEHCERIGQCDFINKSVTLESFLKKMDELMP